MTDVAQTSNAKRFPADEAIHHTGQRGPMVVLASDHDAETDRLQRHLDLRNEQIDGYERQLGIDEAGAEHTISSEIEQLRGNLSLAEEGLANAMQEIEALKVERDFARRELDRACQETREALSREVTAARGSPETCDSDGVIELLQYLDPGCCDCQPCHQCGRMPVECSGTECASTCQCSECGHCRIEYTIASMRLAQKATTETRAFPQAPDTDERYNVSEGLLETLIEVAQDNGFRDVVEALRELQFRRGRHSQKASEPLPPCECLIIDKEPSAYHGLKCPRYVAGKL